MSYGIRVVNANNEVVIDDTLPSYLLSQSATLTGTAEPNGLFSYSISGGLGIPAFVEMEVGDFLGASSNAFFSLKSTLSFKTIKPANELPNPTGYGAVAYNTSGQKTWFANADVAVLQDFQTIPVSGSYNTDANFVALTTRLPLFFQGGGGQFFTSIHGINRVSSTQYIWQSRALGLGPPFNIGPFPVSALFAKN